MVLKQERRVNAAAVAKRQSISAAAAQKKLEIEEQFQSLDVDNTGEISYEIFEGWFSNLLRSDIRAARRMARQLFDQADADKSDSLTKSEMGTLFDTVMKRFPQIELTPPFNLGE